MILSAYILSTIYLFIPTRRLEKPFKFCLIAWVTIRQSPSPTNLLLKSTLNCDTLLEPTTCQLRNEEKGQKKLQHNSLNVRQEQYPLNRL